MEKSRKFWMVWSPGTPKSQPAVRHEFKEIAVDEAQRLACAKPDQEFFVLEALHRVKKVEVAVEDLT